MNKKWWKAACIRALRTVFQTAAAAVGTAVLLTDVDWMAAVSMSVMAGIASLLTSLGGLPEVDG